MSRVATLCRHRARSLLDTSAHRLGLLHLCEYRMRRGLTVLMYHRVLPAAECAAYPLQALVMPVHAFDCQMQFLADHCNVLTLADALTALHSNHTDGIRRGDKPLVAVTFDDGYSDNYELAYPVLKQCGLQATFFVCSGFIEAQHPLWFDRAAAVWCQLTAADQCRLLNAAQGAAQGAAGPQLPPMRRPMRRRSTVSLPGWMEALKCLPVPTRDALIDDAVNEGADQGAAVDWSRFQPMSVSQLQELSGCGHELAAHTVTHPILTLLSPDALNDELQEGRRQLQEWTGQRVGGFCYPNGSYNDNVAQAVQKAGYDYACTTQSGLNRCGTVRHQLTRLAITMQRTLRPDGTPDMLGFRAELCRMRELWR